MTLGSHYFSCHGDPVNPSRELQSQEQLVFYPSFPSEGLQLPSEVLGVRNSVFWMPGWPGWDDMVVGLEKSRPKVLAGAHANPPSKV